MARRHQTKELVNENPETAVSVTAAAGNAASKATRAWKARQICFSGFSAFSDAVPCGEFGDDTEMRLTLLPTLRVFRVLIRHFRMQQNANETGSDRGSRNWRSCS